jgi:subtilisin family serine protease
MTPLGAALVPLLVGLAPFGHLPAPGVLPAGARVSALDPPLGIVSLRLPRRHLARSLARLRAAPGVQFVERERGGAFATSCDQIGPAPAALPNARLRRLIDLSSHRDARGLVIGVVDSGIDRGRVYADGGVVVRNFADGPPDRATDALGHGTAVASLIAADRPDLGVTGVARGAGLAVARVGCRRLGADMVRALRWLRSRADVSIVNISATTAPSPALRRELRALQRRGVLVVAAAPVDGLGFPVPQPGVLAVGALDHAGRIAADSARGTASIYAPGDGLRVIASSRLQSDSEWMYVQEGTSFASPLVAGAAALVWARHPGWTARQVAKALTASARRFPRGGRAGLLDVRRALRY